MSVELTGKIPVLTRVFKRGLPISMRGAQAEEAAESPVREEASMTEKQVRKEVKRLHRTIKDIGEILATSGLEDGLNLGTDVETIRWDLMGRNLAGVFKPEFEFQPEDITRFSIVPSTGQDGGYHGLKISLERRGRWWSYISAEAYNRKSDGYTSPSISIHCHAKEAQVAAARQTVEQLKAWPQADIEDEKLLLKDIKNLGLLTEVVNFTLAQLIDLARQVYPHEEALK